MNCPQCGKSMQRGYLSAGGARLLWTPSPRKFSTLPGENDVLLQGISFTGKNKVEAYLCTECRTVVAQYHED